MINIEIAYANVNQQYIIPLQVSVGCTVGAAIRQSRISVQCPEIDLLQNKVGIFGKLVSLATILQSGDRIEIYRPLLIDPKQARRQRAKPKPQVNV